MNNSASILVLLFLAVTFVQSAYEKVFGWKETIDFMKEHFAKSVLKNMVPQALFTLLILELTSGILSLAGCMELLINGGRTFGYYGAVFSCIALLMMLLGQRLARDYDGARTVAIYFIPAILAVFWLS
jgi:uncharacterized membrane protein YphA (DoxX/SURF4 family)